MNGKIVLGGMRQGILSIERPNGWRIQICPYGTDDAKCGDWCPRFGEPVHTYKYKEEMHEHGTYFRSTGEILRTTLEICKGKVLTFEKFTDERIQKDDPPSQIE